jgi:hypothetical protein
MPTATVFLTKSRHSFAGLEPARKRRLITAHSPSGHSHLMRNSFQLITNETAFLAQSGVKQFIVAVNVLKKRDFPAVFDKCGSISN